MKRFANIARSWLQQRYNRYLVAALLIATLNCATAFGWAVPRVISPDTASSWAIDTIAPVPPLTEAYYRFTREGVEAPVYPLFHYMVLTAVYAPYIAFQYLSGGLRDPTRTFPYGVADPETFFRDLALLAHGVSLLMALGIVATLFAITKHAFTPRAAAWSALFAALLAPLAYYGKTSNLDVPYLFWTLLAVWQYLRIVETQRLRHYVALGVCVAAAVATKDQAYGFFLAAPFALAVAYARHTPSDRPGLRATALALVSRPMLVAGATTALTFALANNLLFGGWDGFVRHIAFMQTFLHENLLTEDPDRRSLGAQFRLLADSSVLLAQMLGYVTLGLCVAGVVLAFLRRQCLALSLLLFPLAYYVSVIAVAGVVVSRYMLGPALLLLPFAGAFMDRALAARGALRAAALALGSVGLAWQLLLSVDLNVALLHDSRYAMEDWIRKHVPPGATIEAQVQQRYLPRLGDAYQLFVAGNAMDVVTYDVLPEELTAKALRARDPDYVLVLRNVGVTGDPDRMREPALRAYYGDLLAGKLGYREVARFETPHLLPYRLITAGTHPTAILLARSPEAETDPDGR